MQKYNKQEQCNNTSYREQYKHTSYKEQYKNTTNRNNTKILVTGNNTKIQQTGTMQKYKYTAATWNSTSHTSYADQYKIKYQLQEKIQTYQKQETTSIK